MDKDTSQLQLYQHFLSFFLLEGILDFFEPVWMETQSLDSRESKKDILYGSSLHIYLDERDNRSEDIQELRPNGFTEETVITDFPVRDRKAVLHVRRRRWLTPEGKNVVLNVYPLAASGTRYCAEFAAFLKDSLGYNAGDGTLLGKFFFTDGDTLERCYKDSLSGFREWEQLDHASDWALMEENIGEHLSIDETSLQDDLFTFLSNKEGHCKKGTIVAAVRGTKAQDVVAVLLKIPEEQRLKVKEVTMDLSESMADIVMQAFPNATIVLDCFHIMRRCNDAIEEMRLRCKREAQAKVRKEKSEFKKRQKRNAAHRRWYRKTHPKKYKGKTRGRKPARKNEKFRPTVLSTGDTLVELLTRCRCALTQTPDKWSERTKERMDLLFRLYPKIKESYDIVNKLRAIFRSTSLDRDAAREKLHGWYKAVNRCTIREIKSARDAIKSREDNVLNYFLERSTNASAESLNSKMKGFRAQLRGVSDLPFFMFRLCRIFG